MLSVSTRTSGSDVVVMCGVVVSVGVDCVVSVEEPMVVCVSETVFVVEVCCVNGVDKAEGGDCLEVHAPMVVANRIAATRRFRTTRCCSRGAFLRSGSDPR